MSHKLSRVPSAEQLTELLQAIVPFMNLNRYIWEVTWRQEDYALPLFVRLADALPDSPTHRLHQGMAAPD